MGKKSHSLTAKSNRSSDDAQKRISSQNASSRSDTPSSRSHASAARKNYSLPTALAALFDQLPVATGDDHDRYKALHTSITQTIEPRDIFEMFWAKDLADHTWEIQRYRKLEANLMEAQDAGQDDLPLMQRVVAEQRATMAVCKWVMDRMKSTGRDRMELWAEIEPERQRLEDEHLADARARQQGRPTRQVDGATFLKNLADLERISRAIALAEARRTEAIRRIDQHRTSQRTSEVRPDTNVTVVEAQLVE